MPLLGVCLVREEDSLVIIECLNKNEAVFEAVCPLSH